MTAEHRQRQDTNAKDNHDREIDKKRKRGY